MGYSEQWAWDLAATPVPNWKKVYGSDGNMHVDLPKVLVPVDIAVAAGVGVGNAVDFSESLNAYQNKTRTLYVWGDFDTSAQVKIEVSPVFTPGPTDWITIPGGEAIITNTVINQEINAYWIRADISGAVSPVLNVRLL